LTTIATRDGSNPFLDLGPAARAALLGYLVIYRIFLPILHILQTGGNHELLGPRIVAETVATLLLAYPLIFHRREYGWLHPLVLPTLFTIGKAIAKNPFTLIFPFDFPAVDYTVATLSPAAALAIPDHDLAAARLGEALIRCLAMAVLLLAFLYGPRLKVPRLKVYSGGRTVPVVAMAMIGVLVAISLAFIAAQGGLNELLVAMRGGRRALFSEQGQFLFVAIAAPTIALVWFTYEEKPLRNVFFVGAFVASALVAILVTGSRSSLILPVLTLVLLYWKRKRRPLIVPTMLVVVFGLLVVGAFGSIRQDFGSSEVDTSVLTPSRWGEMISRAITETQSRDDEESNLAAFQGANSKGLLWGKTYAGALAFFVPRALWETKPRTPDTYNMWINYVGNRIDSEPPKQAYGIPVRAELEAYWNFHVFGVVAIFFLIGIFYRFVANAAIVYDNVPFFWVVYLMLVLTFDGSSKSMVEVLRLLILIGIFLFAARILRLGSGSAQAGPAGVGAQVAAAPRLPVRS